MDMYSVIPNQSVFSGLGQTGAQKGLRLLDIAESVDYQVQQVVAVLRTGISDGSFALRPDVFLRIDFGRVGGKPFQMQPAMAVAKLRYFSVLVDGPTIQKHDHLSAQMPQQLGEILHQLDGRHVPGINLEIQSQTVALRRHGQSSDDRQAIPPVTM